MESTLSATDVALLQDRNGMGFGDNSILWFFAILLLGGGNGFGFGNRGNVATTEDLASGFNFSALQNKTNEILASVNNVNQVLGNAICQLGYEMAQQFSTVQRQISECCCSIKQEISNVRYDMANMFAQTNANTTAVGQKILDKLCGMELAQKDAIIAQQGQRITALEMDARFCGIPRINNDYWGVTPINRCNPCGTCTNI